MGSLLSNSHDYRYQLLRAKSIDQAVSVISRSACHLVLLNYYWGKTKIGEKLLKWAKARKPQIPIIVTSKLFDVEVDRSVIKLGATDYLTTNALDANTLSRAVRYALERKQNYSHINYLIHHDHLTNLPNRVFFQHRLKHSIRIAERENDKFTLMLIDLNNFKEINDIYGHDCGDIFLKEFSKRISKEIGSKGSVYRTGGDEFAVILKNMGRLVQIQTIAENIIAKLSERIETNGHFLAVHCSIGIAVYPKTGTQFNQLLRNADIAMLRAKNETVSSYQFYSQDIEQSQGEYNELQQQFIKALATNQIGLYFNPRIDCVSDQIVGIEVNPYWSHPEKGLLEYEEFVWNGLDNDIAGRFTEWLLRTSFEYLQKLNIAGSTKLIFNIEFQGLSSAGFPQIVEKYLDTYKLKGDKIEFDLSKITKNKHSNVLENCMRRLESKGVRFGINNFGSDDLSLSYIKSLPFTVLKLNKEFVDEIHEKSYDTLLSKALVDFSHSLGKRIVIEGLHSQLPLNNIKLLGFDYYKSVFSVDALSLVKLQDVIENPLNDKPKSKPTVRLINPSIK
jgi:diguanylate cyclase (GGDEF)-like protein